MKNILFIIIINIYLYAQTKQIGLLKYNLIRSTPSVSTIPVKMYFGINESLAIHGKIKTSGSEIVLETSSKVFPFQFKNFKTNEMVSSENPKIVVQDLMEPIEWKIEKETRNIGSFLCNKAIAEVRGRTYTAWYCPKIPSKAGPWKLHGLPGLILEAYDKTGEVKFIFSSLETRQNEVEKIVCPEIVSKQQIMTQKTYLAYLNKRDKKFKSGQVIQSNANSELKIKGLTSNRIEIYN